MKNLLTLFLLSVSIFTFSQDIKRENVKGKIIVEGNDIDGITIFNSSSNLGTVSNEFGEFTIAVTSNDLLEIRAIEYQNFNIKVNKSILESKKLSIFLIEEINRLDEVIVSSKSLTGDIEADLNSIHTFRPKLDVIYFGAKNNNNEDFSTDEISQVQSAAMHSQAQTMVNGLNVINVVDQLLIPLFRSEVKDKKAAGIPEVPAKSIKYYLGSNFLIENFKIPEHRVEEFIRYVEDEAFDFDLLNYGHELEFLELLSRKSKIFLNTKSVID
ncbi:carboxypeptidase-like regulatory domain-containing protein [Lacinutrix jangbogonensis]|uniref:carboxypeptidase-like regulatory domain-containing protein n=1 Tax=Lacinutrix jangbogonensis TaxID=1469557 RepID=UPI00053CF489|nr:carboxypeptidase-like regulatory domain-containing protein [Lacinutrix jangbogonensis]